MDIEITGLTPKVKVEWIKEFPLCPYCTKELDKIEATSKGCFVAHVMYRCPYCKKLIGIGVDR